MARAASGRGQAAGRTASAKGTTRSLDLASSYARWTEAEARERLDYAAGLAHASRASVARMVMVLDT